MDETYTFRSESLIKTGQAHKAFTFVVKADFLKTVPKPEEIEVKDLMQNHQMTKFLHNPTGSALIVYKRDSNDVFTDDVLYEQYWLDGEIVSAEVGEKIKHNTTFNDTMDEVLK